MTELLVSLRLDELGSNVLGSESAAVQEAVVGRFLGILAQIPNLIIEEVVVFKHSESIMAIASSTEPPGVVEWLTSRYQFVGVQEIARRVGWVAAEEYVF